MQNFTSKKTSLNQVPMLHKWFASNVELSDTTMTYIIDYGCGAYDTGAEYLYDNIGECIEVHCYDPYNRDEDTNDDARTMLGSGTVEYALVSNVLNVIDTLEARLAVIEAVSQAETAYFTVYEGNVTGVGKETIKGYQLNRKTPEYMEEIGQVFRNVTRKGKVIIATN